MTINLEKLTPAPWEVNGVALIHNPRRIDPAGRVAFMEPHCQRSDAAFIALARNAFDVMMRRGWHAVRDRSRDGQHWVAVSYEKDPYESNPIMTDEDGLEDWRPDPFTALVEADAWYKANVEKIRPTPTPASQPRTRQRTDSRPSA